MHPPLPPLLPLRVLLLISASHLCPKVKPSSNRSPLSCHLDMGAPVQLCTVRLKPLYGLRQLGRGQGSPSHSSWCWTEPDWWLGFGLWPERLAIQQGLLEAVSWERPERRCEMLHSPDNAGRSMLPPAPSTIAQFTQS